ncbi:40S ribosomal protein S7 [Neolecta irregularis DAH-3]|uniref:40S ribosomal protein S7 n=1 Tax=Neolecta irregularis (strain DAH-3) TaxID=1198029 RepID=A0A1U7LRA8_NEOID|nr:40S ribosomal protein S7 [Neolecta irregularis DAH-3]|eukprot:OLL25051.1 40S ribosomal protein S7 [Neolecta irregularis DAH-3]
MTSKIVKPDGQTLDEFEKTVSQAITDLESLHDFRKDLRPLQFSGAREIEVAGGRKAIVIFVPVSQLTSFHKIQQRLTRELEKKFADEHVVFLAQRRILRKQSRTSRVTQKRPRSRTLTAVHDAMLEDMVYPTQIVGKRVRVTVDGRKIIKVILDTKDSAAIDFKLDSFQSVYNKLTGKNVVFELSQES